jgi:hypothetical protein
MARKRTELNDVPKPRPKLTIPLADAEAKIEYQIEEGEGLFAKERSLGRNRPLPVSD